MNRRFAHSRRLLLCATLLIAGVPTMDAALAQEAGSLGVRVTLQGVGDGAVSDGTMNAAAAAAMRNGPLPVSPAYAAAKAAADRAHARSVSAGTLGAASPAGADSPEPRIPTIVPGRAFLGEVDASTTPPDTTGAVGTTRYIQLVNSRFAIFTRTGLPLAVGDLNTLFASVANNFDPQIIWDNTTNRFYYVGDNVISSSQNRLAFGFSTTDSPSNGSTHWCHYFLDYGAIFPDYPKLGDSASFVLIGVNNFNPGFLRADLIAIRKPTGTGPITSCPSPALLPVQINQNLLNTSGGQVSTPVPASQIDTSTFGAAISSQFPGAGTVNRFTIHPVSQGGSPPVAIFNAPRNVPVAAYAIPPGATQPGLTQLLDTLDARNTQAILATNVARTPATFSLWTQHTIRVGSFAGVRWYEINPVPAVPVILRTGTLSSATIHFFNAAISSDRRRDGATGQFGGSFVVGYNVSSSTIPVRIQMGSSVNGGAFTNSIVFSSPGPYRDFACAGSGATCRWGDYAAATPDPRPTTPANTGVVALTTQFASGDIFTFQSNWRTLIWEARP